ncbi:hypothetical protein QL285_048931 [Trifolium repens]|nr:hypothetical protein QL285_048931 [Trifolium repens]
MATTASRRDVVSNSGRELSSMVFLSKAPARRKQEISFKRFCCNFCHGNPFKRFCAIEIRNKFLYNLTNPGNGEDLDALSSAFIITLTLISSSSSSTSTHFPLYFTFSLISLSLSLQSLNFQ